MKKRKSPFKKGLTIAVHSGFGHPPRKGIVRKVLASGRFVLEGSQQQWRPYYDERVGWLAYVTTDTTMRWPAWIWDVVAQKQVNQHKRKMAWDKLADELMHHWYPTAADLRAIKAFKNEIGAR